jgi:GTP pyrophosphokinase
VAVDTLPSKSRVNRSGERLRAWWNDDLILSREELVEEVEVVWGWRAQHAYPVGLVGPGLRNWVARASTTGIMPSQRLKRLPQIVRKLARHEGMKLARMQDIAGIRAILGGPDEVDAVHEKIREHWKIDREADWRANGRPDTGWRGLHVMVLKRDRISGEDRVVEIQLRTLREHRWAEAVMSTGDRLGFALRDGEGPAELVEYFRVASEVLWLMDRGEAADEALVARFDGLREQVRPFFQRTE